ncbi:hypothetical protein DA075_06660 [Methylobacterium currus]|uniref:Recombinase domain-containing protein n=1 Tax=Methylobacterium currus TaxID=2051553 RepID=A0A2R4WGH8_9HYPH|nr:hypothetical protein [Methylobacterium currus]AWB20645.1 hypothetical protein DA075_06660 [Methylobacterium currus]
MDQTTLASSIERIAVALERIADALKPVVIEARPHIEAWKPDIALYGSTVEPAVKGENRVERKIRSLFDEGFTSYTRIANELNRRGLMTEAGTSFHPSSVKRIMKGMGLESPHTKIGHTKAAPAPAPEAAAEPDPDPDPAPPPTVLPKPAQLLDTEKDRKRRERNARYMAPQRRQLTKPKPKPTSEVADDASLIAAALAAGKVTHCPPFQGADGFNYRTGMFEE